ICSSTRCLLSLFTGTMSMFMASSFLAVIAPGCRARPMPRGILARIAIARPEAWAKCPPQEILDAGWGMKLVRDNLARAMIRHSARKRTWALDRAAFLLLATALSPVVALAGPREADTVLLNGAILVFQG